MASSPSDISILNSTSKLFSYLNLNNEDQKEVQNMEEIDIDQVMEVPDTPDRLVWRRNSEDLSKECSSSVMGDSGNSDLANGARNRLRNRIRWNIRNGNNPRSHSRHQGDNSFRDERSQTNRTIISLSDSPSTIPKSARHSIRTIGDQVLKESGTVPSMLSHGHRGSNNIAPFEGETSDIAKILVPDPKYLDKNTKKMMPRSDSIRDTGKNACPEIPSAPSSEDDNNLLDATVRSVYAGVPQRARSYGALKDLPVKEIKKGSIGCSSRGSLNSSGAILDHGKGIMLSCDYKTKAEQTISTKNTRQRRLIAVHNGCISPCNTARSKHTSEHVSSFKGGLGETKVIYSGGFPSNDMNNLASNSEGNQSVRMDNVKGKGVMVDPPQAKEYDSKVVHLPGRSLNTTKDDNGIKDISEHDYICSNETNGWRNIRGSSKIISSDMSDEEKHLSRRNIGKSILIDQSQGNTSGNGVSGINTSSQSNFIASAQSVQASPSATPELGPENGKRVRVNKFTKRHRKHSLARDECSNSNFDEREITYLGSSGEPATTRTTRNRDSRHRDIKGPVIEIDRSPKIIRRRPENTSQEMVDGDSDARLRQMEADEILARQLQEQLYDETPGFGNGENDAVIAWRLQQQEDSQRLSLGGQRRSNHRDSSMSHLYRRYPSESFPDSSNRSTNRARGSVYTRTARLRNNFRHPPTVSSSRGRHSRFPANMDIDTRMHILEALEAAVSDRNSMTTAGHFFQVQRDFNENDYEMLLALDENNHQHVGASLNQVNGLPQSTVQTENFEETCAICLETPTIGDTIRHLPCLHKFHKDCIDQWLRRSTSCPVCKSGIN